MYTFCDCLILNRVTVTQASSSKEDGNFRFVEQPSEDFFCPVTLCLLLQPHLTTCCGTHLSQEAANKIMRDKKPCPLCKASNWMTMLDKFFQRRVMELHVFCTHNERGCGWQGALSDLERHVQSCPMKDSPLMADLVQLPL